jgi:AraC-like DNA-binding protein
VRVCRPSPGGAAIRNVRRAAHDESTSLHREALRAFVDVFQVLAGRVETNEELAALVRPLLMRMLRRLPEPSSVQPTKNFRVVRVLGYLEEQFADAEICLASAARHVDVTPPHLDRLLKGHTGLTFLQHLRRIRMRHAERLLLMTTSSIKETAYACGYAGTGAFGRDFKRTHGCAAGAWRAMGTLISVRELKRADRRVR